METATDCLPHIRRQWRTVTQVLEQLEGDSYLMFARPTYNGDQFSHKLRQQHVVTHIYEDRSLHVMLHSRKQQQDKSNVETSAQTSSTVLLISTQVWEHVVANTASHILHEVGVER